MSTRARIGMVNADASISSVYTHSDGYPSHHAPILATRYSTPRKVRALLSLGDLSELGSTPGRKHAFDDRAVDQCTAYGRDRGDSDINAQRSVNLNAFQALADSTWAEYAYLFKEGKWWVCHLPAFPHLPHTWAEVPAP